MVHQLADVRSEERRDAAAAFLTLFGALAGHTLLETARDALFLARLPPTQLPWVYLAIAALAVVVSQGPWRPEGRAGQRFGMPLVLLGTAAVTLMFWLYGSWEEPWALRALYVWTGLVGTLTGLQFWLAMGELYTVTQAKRLYKLIGFGGLLGAVAGATAAREIATRFGVGDLVLAAALTLAASGLGPALLLRRPEGVPAVTPVASLSEAAALLRSQPYLRHLAGLVLVSTVTLTLADYLFKSSVARHIPPDQLGSFFAAVYAVLNVLALVAQTFLIGWLLRTVGLQRSLWVLPALIFGGAAGVVLGGGLLAALVLKGSDGALRHSLHRTSTELLFVPLPDGLRRRAKPFIDVIGQRGGQALASLFILSELGVRRGDMMMATVLAGLCLLWVVVVSELREHYLDLFRTALREGTIRTARELPELDLNSLEALFAALNSRDDAEVTGAMEFLGDQGRTRLIPALVLYHPSQPVVLRAFELFERSGRDDFLPIADRLTAHPDPEIRAAALRARSSVRPDPEALRKALDDPSPLMRSTALVGLIAGSWLPEPGESGSLAGTSPERWIEACVSGTRSDRSLADLVRSGASVDGCIALARAIRRQPSPVFEQVLIEMADSSSPELQVEVAHAMGAVRSERFLPALLPMLAAHDTRAAARSAFAQHAEEGLRFLGEALDDARLPREIRRHLPRTLTLFPAQAAAELLQARVADEADGRVRFKIISALGRLATDNPELRLDGDVLRQAIERSLTAAFRLVHWRHTLRLGALADAARATRGHELLVTLLRDKQTQVTERVFRLLDMSLRHEDLKRIHRGLWSSSPRVRANSRELLENLLRPPLRDAVLALVDEGAPASRRLELGGAYYVPLATGYEELLGQLIDEPSETIRSVAAFHVGELGLVELRDRLERLDPNEAGFFTARVVERTLRILSGPGGFAHAR
jgi:hypothetical protein